MDSLSMTQHYPPPNQLCMVKGIEVANQPAMK